MLLTLHVFTVPRVHGMRRTPNTSTVYSTSRTREVMYLRLLLIIAYATEYKTQAFSATSLVGSSNRIAVTGNKLSTRYLPHRPHHQGLRHMSASAEATLAWPPADRLSEYVTGTCLVDYGRLAAQESEWLDPALALVKKTSPNTDADRHAFLINAYNLWTIYWVIRERRWPGFKGATGWLSKARFFYWHKIVVSGKKWNLFDFENKAIRPDVDDARVHFALNCASMSCPPLRRKLFTGAALDAELDEVTSAAINGGAMVQLKDDGKTLMVNPIFKWYKEDFDKDGGVLAFIKSRWTGPPLPEDATVDFFTYDWRTNSVDATWSDRALGGPAP